MNYKIGFFILLGIVIFFSILTVVSMLLYPFTFEDPENFCFWNTFSGEEYEKCLKLLS